MKPNLKEPLARIAHQLRWDLRAQRRWLVAVWMMAGLLFGASFVPWPGAELQTAIQGGLLVAIGLLVAATSVLLIQADPVTGSSAGWMTRPFGRGVLWLAKATFVVGLLILPLAMMAGLSVVWRGSGLREGLLLVMEVATFLACLTGFAAATAAVAQGLPGTLAAGVGAFVLCLIWATVLEWLQALGAVARPSAVEMPDGSMLASRITAAFVGVLVGGWMTWWLATLRRLKGAALLPLGGALFLFPILLAYWEIDFLRLRTPTPPALTLVDAEAGENPRGPARGQRLWSRFQVEDLPESYASWVQGFQGEFRTPNGSFHTEGLSNVRAVEPWETDPGLRVAPPGAALAWIRSQYPSDTHWRRLPKGAPGPLSISWKDHLGNPNLPPRTTGRLVGTLAVGVVAIRSVADLPILAGSSAQWSGHRLTLDRVEWRNDGMQLELRDQQITRLWGRNDDSALLNLTLRLSSQVLLVVHHPGTGEAFFDVGEGVPTFLPIPGIATRRLRVTLPYPDLRERLSGVSRQDWLSGARLHIFATTYRGSRRQEVEVADFLMEANAALTSVEAAHQRHARIAAATLSPDPGPDEIARYVDLLVQGFPDGPAGPEDEVIRNKLREAGTAGIAPLLAHAPFSDNHRQAFVLPTLRALARPEHLTPLKRALALDPSLAEVFLEKGWLVEARAVLIQPLRERRVALPLPALLILAQDADPSVYPDLLWHFSRLSHGYTEAIEALRRCPGLELRDSLEEAWHRARVGLGSPDVLALPAAAEGLPEALAHAVRLLGEPLPESRRTQLLNGLNRLTPASPQGPAFVPWLRANLGRLRYQPDSHTYSIAD